MTTNDSIHGHEIIRLVAQANPSLTKDALAVEIGKRYGDGVHFHACSDDNMTLDGLLEFLAARGKVVEVDGQLRADISLMCDDD